MANQLHFGVVVGINCYPEFQNLRFAKTDAEAFAEWLLNQSGGNLPSNNIKLIVAEDDVMPTNTIRENAVPVRTMIYTAIKRFWKRVKTHVDENPEDWHKSRLYFYVSGHGIGPSTQDVALLMANAGPEDYGENISCRELLHCLGDNQYFAEVVIFTDCCRDRAPNAPLGSPPWTKKQRDYGEVKTALGVAADFGGKAYEPDSNGKVDPDDYRGYYTKALLEGLYGHKIQGEVNSKTLADYIQKRVKELLTSGERTQNCHMYGDFNSPIVFSEQTNAELSFDIRFDTDYQGIALLLYGDGQEIERWQVDGEGFSWPVSLAQGLYRVVPMDGNQTKFKNDGYFAVIGGEDVIL